MKIDKLEYFYKRNNKLVFIAIIISKIIYRLVFPLIQSIFRYLIPIKGDRILFVSSPDYSDNGRILSEYIMKKKNYDITWLVDNPESFQYLEMDNLRFIQEKGKYHNYLTLKALYYAASSSKIFYTHSFSKLYKKKNGQLIINLWHGCGYKDNTPGDKEYSFDYVLVPGEIFIKSKSRFFDCTEDKILEIGYPRYDLLRNESEVAKKFIYDLPNGSIANKIIIWMPTFRKSDRYVPENEITYNFDLPLLSSKEEMIKLNDYCRIHDILIIIKKHKNQIDYKVQEVNLSNIKFLTDVDLNRAKIQLYELLPFTDALITDYSSVAIDYLLLDKPIGFSLDDFEEYRATRGFIFENVLDYMPGHHMYSINDLYNFLDDIVMGKDDYKENREKIREITHNPTEGYSQRIIEHFNL